MKKLNITKKQFSESKYFQTKYGKLKYVSESGNVYKTSKGHVLRFDEGLRREVVPMNGRKSFGSKSMEEDDGDGFTLFSYETPVARLERREDGSGMDFILLSDYLSSTTLTHIHSWLIGHNQKDIPTKKLLQMNVGDSVPMMASESKKMFNEGAGAGYEITVEDIEIDKVLSVKMGDEKGSWAEFEATIKPCNVVVSAEGYYDVFCKDEHVKIEGGTIKGTVFDTIDYFKSEEDALEYAKSDLEGSLIDIKTMYGRGWVHSYLPEDGDITFTGEMEATYCHTIDKINIQSQEMSDIVNSGYDFSQEEQESEDEEFDESFIGDKVKDGWKKVKDGAKKLKTKIGDMFNGPFRRGERVEMSGENGETVKGTIMGFDLGDKTYTVLLGRDEY